MVALVCLSRWWHGLIGNYIAEKKRECCLSLFVTIVTKLIGNYIAEKKNDCCFSLFVTMVAQVDWQLYSREKERWLL